jgi:hypothetical protein
MGKRRHGVFEEFDLFATELRKIEEQSRKVASRTADPSLLAKRFSLNVENKTPVLVLAPMGGGGRSILSTTVPLV